MKRLIPEHILAAFNRGDADAFRLIYETLFATLQATAFTMIRHTQAAKDITAEAFIHCWSNRGNFESEEKLQSFLYTAIRSRCLNYIRDEKLHEQKEPEIIEFLHQQSNPSGIDELAFQLLLKKLYDAIDQLPRQCRAVCELAYKFGLDNGTISRRLKIAEKTVRNQKTEGQKRLKIILSDFRDNYSD